MDRTRLQSVESWLARYGGWLLLALVVGLSVQYTLKALSRPHRTAILRWQPQLLDLEEGENIAETHNYPNPPIMALILLPLVKLPPLAAGLLWFYLKVAMTGLALVWIFRMVEAQGRPFPLWARVLTILLSLRPVMGDLQHGNVNLFILFLVVGFLFLWSRGRDLFAGATLGLAIACKVTPALFIPYLVWKRSWRATASCVLGLGLFLWPGLVPALVLGWDDNREHLVSWYGGMVRPFLVEGRVTSEQHNQSLPGLVYRLTTHSPSASTYVNDVYTPLKYDNVVTLELAQARWLVKGCMGLFGLLILWTCRAPTEPRGGWRLAAEVSLIALGMLLFSERTWKHHCVTLVLPFAVLSYYLLACRPGPRLRGNLIASLAASALLMASTSTGLLPKPWAKEAQVWGAYVLAYVVLSAALAVLLRQPPRAAAETSSTTGERRAA